MGDTMKARFERELYIQEAVRCFSFLMRKKLYANNHKGLWLDCSYRRLLSLLKDEVKEHAHAKENEPPDNIMLEAADVANFAMMIADLARRKIEEK
ncbi:MAG: hypothetical protein DRO04_00040 [Candidatus Iainarchaeum archaeon]|uniref:Nucleotide pyrophosphohydrolase n=1 Tax=Candidatus Iainarchaeum sp. TaxID=3101447 RepID=A0A497JIG3_9ARCH|nr:MAG: hypothetical protein DRO04_00040 [Candidatus Diapherotrites archaeon]